MLDKLTIFRNQHMLKYGYTLHEHETTPNIHPIFHKYCPREKFVSKLVSTARSCNRVHSLNLCAATSSIHVQTKLHKFYYYASSKLVSRYRSYISTLNMNGLLSLEEGSDTAAREWTVCCMLGKANDAASSELQENRSTDA